MIVSQLGQDSITAGEKFAVFGTPEAFNRERSSAVIYCHGSGHTAETIVADASQLAVINGLAQDRPVIAADLGGQTWGNDTAITRIGQAIDYAISAFGARGQAVLVAGSMGVLGALAFTLANPGRVQLVAGIIPALDLNDLWTNNRGGSATAGIDAAYAPYVPATHDPTHSPVSFAASLSATLPIGLWTSSDDTLAVPSTATAFVTARPGTYRENLGALGHTTTAVTASAAPVQAFVRKYAR